MACGGRNMNIECSVCKDVFETPKILPCYHTFCQKCIEDLVSHAAGGGRSFNCPTCRKSTQVPQGGVSTFQTNFYLDPDLEKHEARERQKREKCVLHKDKVANTFCKTCRIPVCHACIGLRHGQHNVVLLEEEASTAANEIKSFIKDLTAQASTLENAIVSLPDVKLYKKKAETARKDVRDLINSCMEKLNQKQNEAVRQIKNAAARHEQHLSEAMLHCQVEYQKKKASAVLANDALENQVGITLVKARDRLETDLSGQTQITRLTSELSHASKPLTWNVDKRAIDGIISAVDSLSVDDLVHCIVSDDGSNTADSSSPS